MTPDPGAQPGEPSPADGPGPRELLAYRSAQGRWVVAAMILGLSVAGIDSTVVAVALPAIGRNLHAGFQALQWTVTAYTLTLASLILLADSLDRPCILQRPPDQNWHAPATTPTGWPLALGQNFVWIAGSGRVFRLTVVFAAGRCPHTDQPSSPWPGSRL